jgi:hypothetical protein
VDEAIAALARAEDELERGALTAPAAGQALIEARFGLMSALRRRPEDRRAQSAVERVLRRSIEREIALGSPVAARALLGGLAMEAPDLEAGIAALEAASEAERSAARAHEASRRDADASPVARLLAILLVGGAVIGYGIVLAQIIADPKKAAEFPIESALAWEVSLLLGGTIALWFARKRVLVTTGAQTLAWYALITWSSFFALDLVSYVQGLSTRQAAFHTLSANIFLCATMAVRFPGFAFAGLSLAFALVGSALVPAWHVHFVLSAALPYMLAWLWVLRSVLRQAPDRAA